MLKVLIVILLLAVIVSLFSGLFFLIKDDGNKTRVLNSLIIRVGLSLTLVAVIILAMWHGDISLNPTP
ncbi:twin transmembrane helix small protein [Marinobacter sp. 1Y8]